MTDERPTRRVLGFALPGGHRAGDAGEADGPAPFIGDTEPRVAGLPLRLFRRRRDGGPRRRAGEGEG